MLLKDSRSQGLFKFTSGIQNKIWIVGSSIIKRAFTYARQSTYDGPKLDMQRQGAEIRWQGKGGLRTKQLSSFVHLLLSVEDPPDIMVIHCGGNDIGSTPALKLRADILRELDEVRSLVPGVLIVWSQILPRFEWRGEKSHSALNNVRERVNNKVATEVINNGGRYIKYPEIREEDHFFVDKVHLSDMGNNLFLHRIQEALQCFLTSYYVAFPAR